MAQTRKSRFWRLCRIYFRRFRIAVWIAIFLVVAFLVYLNQVGLPDLVKKPLLETLRARGLDVQFSRMRLSFYRGIIGENLRFSRSEEPTWPQLSVREARIKINYTALLHRQLQIDSLALREGRLVIPVVETNVARREILVTNIQTDLRFLPADSWVLDNLQAEFAGCRLRLLGFVSHASAVLNWKLSTTGEPTPAEVWHQRIRRLADTLEATHFSNPPELKLAIRGDARDVQSFAVKFMISAPGADTPWGSVHSGQLTARLEPATNQGLARIALTLDAGDAQSRWANATNFQMQAWLNCVEGSTNISDLELLLDAGVAQTRWATGTNLHLNLRAFQLPGQTNLVVGELAVRAEGLNSRWASATHVVSSASWTHSFTNPIPLDGQIELRCVEAFCPWAKGTEVNLTAQMAPSQTTATRNLASRAWWTNLEPYDLTWQLSAAKLDISNTVFQAVDSSGHWTLPELQVTNLSASAGDGNLKASAALNVDNRDLALTLNSTVDPHKIQQLLPETARRWLAQFTWNKAPQTEGNLSIVLPAWTNRQPDWRGEVRPTLKLIGSFAADRGGTYRKLEVSAARSHFFYTNLCWFLPDLQLTRPEGTVLATHRADDQTKDFWWKVRSTFNPDVLRPLLGTNEARGLDIFSLTQPPRIEAEIRGRGREADRFTARGLVALTNFTVREQWFGGVQAAVTYSNKVLRFIDPRVQRGTQHLSADALAVDLARQLIYLTNGHSTSEVLPVARAIGTKVGTAIEPYQFSLPPTVDVSGIIPLRGEEGADLRFQVRGGPFHWHRFHVPRISGDVHWQGLRLDLSNLDIDFYGGNGTGNAQFNFPRGVPGADYSFVLTTTNTILRNLMEDYFGKTNSLEGTLDGFLVLQSAHTEDWRTANGYGSAVVRDGYIWELPIFGVFSPMLNAVIPGLGTSRFTSATCDYTITNGVIWSDTLEARAPALRLQYRGSVDLEGNVKARVEAEILRNIWAVGPLVSTVLWPVTKMFEYRVAGTLGEPKVEPVYIFPKLMALPFQPFRILRGLIPEDSKKEKKSSGFSEPPPLPPPP